MTDVEKIVDETQYKINLNIAYHTVRKLDLTPATWCKVKQQLELEMMRVNQLELFDQE